VRSWKFFTFRWAMPPYSAPSTEMMRMWSRMMASSRGALKPSRMMVSSTRLPAGPRIRCSTSDRSIPCVLAPSMATSSSPARMPARAAGVSSMGATTTMPSPLRATSMPSPPNSPEVSIFISLKTSGGMKRVCGSNVSNIPLMAPCISFWLSTGST
jgi:hypothetical protein